MACYSGPNPVEDPEERMAIWKWAKANGIDHGLPFRKIHDAINAEFFGGAGRPEWINEILSGRKTPYRPLAEDAWRRQNNRRAIVKQASKYVEDYSKSLPAKAFEKLWSLPRGIATFLHGWVFPITHAGELLLRPFTWHKFFRGLLDTYSKSFSPGATERVLDAMRRNPNYDLARQSGLVGEEGVGNLISNPPAWVSKAPKWVQNVFSQSSNAWNLLTKLRFDLWDYAMRKHLEPGMTHEERLAMGRQFADWANHATGTTTKAIPHAEKVLFGPRLTASKFARLGDIGKTAATFYRMRFDPQNVTPGEKAVAWTRVSGLTQYLVTGLGFLGANWGLNKVAGVPDKDNVNFSDPSRSDFLSFKAGGIRLSIPGLHSELKVLAQLMAIPFMDKKAIEAASYGKAKTAGDYFNKVLIEYALGKAVPNIGLAKEALTGEVFPARPAPWSLQPGTAKHPRMSWDEWLASHGPIIASEPARYVYEQLRKGGTGAFDAATIVKGLIISALGATGLHAAEAKEAPTPRPTPLRQAVRRQRAAQALQNR
jgi:hypothetical protein